MLVLVYIWLVPEKLESCDFETKTCPFWQQSLDDDTDWMLNSGPTPSHNTGPKTGNDDSSLFHFDRIFHY